MIRMASCKLLIFVSPDHPEYENLINIYDGAIQKHNQQVERSMYADAGFDVYTPCDEYQQIFEAIDWKDWDGKVTKKVNMNLRVAMYMQNSAGDFKPSACYLYARSSIAKYPFRCANNQGIIDSGYRGNLISMLDTQGNNKKYLEDYEFIKKGCETPIRLTQICAPNLQPFTVRRVTSIDDLGITDRGEGGIGSTGQ